MVQLNVPLTDLATICRASHVRELAVFGSVVHGTAREQSDIDILVAFQPDARIGFLAIAALTEQLEGIFGRRVDLAIKSGLKPAIREKVLRDAEVLFAEG